MAGLTKPDFTLRQPNPAPGSIPDPVWWLWLTFDALHPDVRLGGIVADKPGFHSSGKKNAANWPQNYSIRDAVNRSGVGWEKASALDLTFPDAQGGDYRSIDKYTSRLMASALDAKDPRLDMILFEFYGQADSDKAVEGYNEYREDAVTSDSSHLWHIHLSFLRSKVGDWWGMWALYTVLAGWTVEQWRASLPESAPKPPVPVTPRPPVTAKHAPGSRELRYVPGKLMTGDDVEYVQRWIGPRRMGPPDGKAGPKFDSGVKWYQRMRGLDDDGIVGRNTWRHMGVRARY